MNRKIFDRKIFFGGPIITLNDKQPIVEAVGVIGEKINSVGHLEYVKNTMESDYNLVNLNGSTLLPGFID
ncbi:MAG: amidohydrolase, partial [Candidatus Lokiarchaeota archaeon]|nr:amidohydrolase [Candidatus Lokiarchaeota archaeon]